MPNHKASCTCPQCGKTIHLGRCTFEKRRLLRGPTMCGSRGYDWEGDKLRCVGCNTAFSEIQCPECGESVPVNLFRPRKLTDIFRGRY